MLMPFKRLFNLKVTIKMYKTLSTSVRKMDFLSRFCLIIVPYKLFRFQTLSEFRTILYVQFVNLTAFSSLGCSELDCFICIFFFYIKRSSLALKISNRTTEQTEQPECSKSKRLITEPNFVRIVKPNVQISDIHCM